MRLPVKSWLALYTSTCVVSTTSYECRTDVTPASIAKGLGLGIAVATALPLFIVFSPAIAIRCVVEKVLRD